MFRSGRGLRLAECLASSASSKCWCPMNHRYIHDWRNRTRQQYYVPFLSAQHIQYISPSTLLDAPTSCSCKRLGCRKCLINLISRSLRKSVHSHVAGIGIWWWIDFEMIPNSAGGGSIAGGGGSISAAGGSMFLVFTPVGIPVELWGFYVLLNIKKLSKTLRLGNHELKNRKTACNFKSHLEKMNKVPLQKKLEVLVPHPLSQ